MTPTYSLYGITMATEFRFVNRLTPAEAGSPDVAFECRHNPPEDLDLTSLLPVFSGGDRGDGKPSFALFRVGHVDVVHVEAVADFYLYQNRIVGHLLDSERAYMIEILLLGTVLAYWLERRGVVALHASAATIDGCAVGFAGLNGGGKTSLAASLFARGYRLLTDDILAVTLDAGGPVAHSGYPQMRMWPNLADYFVGGSDSLDIVHPDFDKRRVAVGEDGIGSFHPQPLPLVGLYLPRRTTEGGARPPTFEPLPLRDAVVWLAGVSFVAPIAESGGMQPERLPRLRRVAEAVPVFSFSYPSGLSHLPEVAKSIDDHVRAHCLQSKSAPGGMRLDSNT